MNKAFACRTAGYRKTLPVKRLRLLLLCLLTAWFFSTPLAAKTYGLFELYSIARSYDAAYLASKANLEATYARVARTDSLRWPKVSMSMSYSREGVHTSDLPDELQQWVYGNTHSRSLNLRAPLYDKSTSPAIRKARVELEIAKSDLVLAEQQLMMSVATGYFDLLSAIDRLAFTQSNKEAIQASLNQAEIKLRAGTGTISDVKEAQARFDLALADEISARGTLSIQQLKLEKLVGLQEVQPKSLIHEEFGFSDELKSVEHWIGLSDSHPTILQARQRLEVSQLDTSSARSAYYPKVDLVGAIGMEKVSGDPLIGSGDTESRTIGMELKWELFSGYATSSHVREMKALETKARRDLDITTRDVQESVQSTYFKLQAAISRVEALKAAVLSSFHAHKSVELGFRLGDRLNVDVLDAQTRLFETELDLADARYKWLLELLQLYTACGQLTTEKYQLVSALLDYQP